ncbi:GNAT family N-acetyltransferase [Nocardioides ginkgobilobae]
MAAPTGSVALTLPPGYTARPLTAEDARGVFEVMAAQEKHDVGTVEIEEADIVADWQRPGYVVEEHGIGVFSGETLVAYSEHVRNDRGDAAVHPEHRGKGIGTALAGWMQETARAAGATVVGMPVPQGSAGDRLLESLGYRARWESWVLELPEGAEVADRPLPQGYTVRAAELPAEGADRSPARSPDYEGAWTVQEDAFLEWSDRPRDTFEEWAAGTVQRPGFEPWHLRVVVDPDGRVVGMAFLIMAGQEDGTTQAYIDRLATAGDQRGKGLGQALLADAFRVAREHGATSSSLSTDSRTGALGLYEKVGMVVSSTWVNRAIDL